MPPEDTNITVRHPLIDGTPRPAWREDEILIPEALEFLRKLHRNFAHRRAEILNARMMRRREIANGHKPKFLPETQQIRHDHSWTVAPLAPGLEDRRVEITGPTERKMTINALNSGAKVWLADQEDANTLHWDNVIGGQVNLKDAIRGTIEYTNPDNGKEYRLHSDTLTELPTIVLRPRGWHLTEKHIHVGRHRISGSLVDFGLYFFHNARELIERKRGPYFYLPKMESHQEARLWHDVFDFSEDYLGIPHGTIRATCLIETITAAFEMEEILYELREYSSGLNAGRWDYIFSIIKKFRDSGPSYILPDRADVTMTVPMMRAYTELLVRTCHKRNASAIGGMSAFIPSRDPARNEEVERIVRTDKAREARDGFDGSWCAHPGMVNFIRDEFDKVLGDNPHQIDNKRADVHVTREQLLDVKSTPGHVTEEGLRTNIAVALRYLGAWLSGNGAAAIFGLMEDAATAEISRSQIWQWIHNGTTLTNGKKVTRELVHHMVEIESARYSGEVGNSPDMQQHVADATTILEEISLGEEFPAFLTTPVYANYIP